MVTAVERSALADATGSLHGFHNALTSFVGRARVVGEVAAQLGRHLDAEEVTLRHALAWASDHDPVAAVRLTLALAPWWRLRGRLSSQTPLLAVAAESAEADSDEWCSARLYLGQAVGEAEDPPAMLEHFTAVRDALDDPRRGGAPSTPVLLSVCLGARASALLRLGRVAEAVEDGRRGLDLALQTGSGGLQAMALSSLSLVSGMAATRTAPWRSRAGRSRSRTTTPARCSGASA